MIRVSYSSYEQSCFLTIYKIVVFLQRLLQKLDQHKLVLFFQIKIEHW